MPKITPLDKQWEQLMALCQTESKLRESGGHPRLLKHVSAEIDTLAETIGFSPRRIATRDFRAHRNGHHIIAIIPD
jgi:hypothetical protein